ncbi:uncharacterized protein LOC133295685 isoform X1 [Gastrolobium bilobum]|uniref:uncharacterized protein LOC133295685 isoform X1 n=1 Tax=Gastrolobium bilobum TaxID=150636 RepID=UPI002AB2CC37|nr:uncharacterized protein LOC133295685 isoform X1 [Gastrolobium bilobum]
MAAQVFLVKICDFNEVTKRGKMNCYGYQKKNTLTSCEEMMMESVVCPKPRRLGLLNHSSINNHIRPLRRPISYQSEIKDLGIGRSFWTSSFLKGSCSKVLFGFGDVKGREGTLVFCIKVNISK